MGIQHTTFFDVALIPLACAKAGAEQMKSFKPDCIIALGGGSAMDAVRLWVLYGIHGLYGYGYAFVDIRKRVYTFSHGG